MYLIRCIKQIIIMDIQYFETLSDSSKINFLNEQDEVFNQFAADAADEEQFREMYDDWVADIYCSEMKENPDYGYC